MSLGLVEAACGLQAATTEAEVNSTDAIQAADAEMTSVETTSVVTEHVATAPSVDTRVFPCTDDQQILLGGYDTGRMRCREGAQHRALAATCPLADFLNLPPDAPAPPGRCKSDADCREGSVCDCAVSPSVNFVDGVRVEGFSYGGGVCTSASCRTDADCGEGLLCVQAAVRGTTADGCSALGQIFVCQSPQDECASAGDCGTDLCFTGKGHLACEAAGSFACGRPLLIAGAPRLAGLVANDDWSGPARPLAAALDDAERAAVAGHWTDMALAEHASIAAFARFTLQLLQLGAPLALVERSQQALADETAHAKACFALAARYAGTAWGPAELRLDDVTNEQDLLSIVQLTFREGCIGETGAALEACEALATATDNEVRDALTRIAEDERRHAELAWATVAWALSRDGTGEVSALLARELADVLARLGTRDACCAVRPSQLSSRLLEAHGVPHAARRVQLRELALRELIAPCLLALLERSHDHAPDQVGKQRTIDMERNTLTSTAQRETCARA